jgi:outer membrane protein assembly factor BamA
MRSYLLMFYLFLTFISFGQKKYILTFTNLDYSEIKKNINTKFKDSIEAKQYLSNLRLTAIKKGFLIASIDSTFYRENELNVSFYLGPKFKTANLHLEKNDILFYRQYMHVNEKFFNQLKFSTHELASTLKLMQFTLEKNGYPFGKIFLDSIKIDDNHLIANVNVQKNQFIKWKEIHIKGDSAISKVFLSNIIRIKPGDKYNQEDLNQISKRLKQVNFIKEIKNHEVLFTKDGAELFIYVKSNPISSINGVVGLQPNSKTNKVDLTGDISLKLLNVIKRGELLEFNWKSMQAQTQSLKGKINYPFIFKTPFGIDGQFNLYKRDTTYLELKSTLGIQYFLKGGNYLKIFYQNSSSNVLSGGINNPKFVNLGSVSTNSYGIAILKKQVDYIPNPSRGFVFSSEVAIGNRKSRITDTSNVILSNTYRNEVLLELFFPLAKRHIIRFANQTDFYYAPKIFQNEVTRFGGLSSQRGFNEEELFSTTKSLFSFEYRFLVDQNSRAFIFYDQSWYENNSSIYYNDKPFGFGAGFSFGTNIGIFSISYAQGKQFNNPILIKNGKVHFGYVAYF